MVYAFLDFLGMASVHRNTYHHEVLRSVRVQHAKIIKDGSQTVKWCVIDARVT